MTKSDAQSRTQQMGGAQNRTIIACADDSHGTETTQGESGTGRAIGERLHRNHSEARIAFWAGGIIAQLIKDAEDRLGEMKECVQWYQREVEKQEARIFELQQFRDSLESDIE